MRCYLAQHPPPCRLQATPQAEVVSGLPPPPPKVCLTR